MSSAIPIPILSKQPQRDLLLVRWAEPFHAFGFLKAALSLIPPIGSYRAAMTRLAIAATLNHIRRIFVPWLGQYVCGYESPLDDLRLARSNPDVFVAAMLGGTTTTTSWWGWWGWVLFSCGQKGLWDILGSYLAERLLWLDASGGSSSSREDDKGRDGGAASSEGCGESRSRSRSKAIGKKRTTKKDEDARTEFYEEMIKTGYLAYFLAQVEYLFARGTNTAAWCIALYKLLSGGESTSLRIALQQNWTRVPLATWLLGNSLIDVVLPLLREALVCAMRGQLGLLMAVVGVLGGVMGLVKYRSTVYIALEVSGMFIFGGYVLAGLVMIGVEWVLRPTGSDQETSAARFPGCEDAVYSRKMRGSRVERGAVGHCSLGRLRAGSTRRIAPEHGSAERDVLY